MIKTDFDPNEYLKKTIKDLANYIKTNGLQSAILGISGGIDSTVVAYILNKVETQLVAEGYNFEFLGYSLPTDTTDSQEFAVSKLIGETLCKHGFEVKNIEKIARDVMGFCGGWSSKSEYMGNLRHGNIKARLRTMFLYDQAQTYKGIVIGTDNYTEYLLGFSTIGGDGLFDYGPIQWLWKTEVYMLANHIVDIEVSREHYDIAHVVKQSIKLTPMDGLGISSSDMDQIGAKSYYDVDEILKMYKEDPSNVYDALAGKFGSNTIDKVIDRHLSSWFKRNHPICPER